jgi:folate-binding Fe-S cluster repair protein YgfZ
MVQLLSPPGYQAARHAAALVDRSDRGRLLVSGGDRAAYLHGLLTNDIAALAPGSGCYAAYLTPQGRMSTSSAT